MADQIVPVTSAPNQQLAISLNVDGGALSLQLALSWNQTAGYWQMQVSDQIGNLLVDSIPLVTGAYPAANLLAQYAYLKIGSAYVLNVSGTAAILPNTSNLGSAFVLLWGDTPAF